MAYDYHNKARSYHMIHGVYVRMYPSARTYTLRDRSKLHSVLDPLHAYYNHPQSDTHIAQHSEWQLTLLL